jgi:hypothetical protein
MEVDYGVAMLSDQEKRTYRFVTDDGEVSAQIRTLPRAYVAALPRTLRVGREREATARGLLGKTMYMIEEEYRKWMRSTGA